VSPRRPKAEFMRASAALANLGSSSDPRPPWHGAFRRRATLAARDRARCPNVDAAVFPRSCSLRTESRPSYDGVVGVFFRPSVVFAKDRSSRVFVRGYGNGKIGKICGKAASRNDSCLCSGICGGHDNPRPVKARLIPAANQNLKDRGWKYGSPSRNSFKPISS
jgi:hypothetical protein